MGVTRGAYIDSNVLHEITFFKNTALTGILYLSRMFNYLLAGTCMLESSCFWNPADCILYTVSSSLTPAGFSERFPSVIIRFRWSCDDFVLTQRMRQENLCFWLPNACWEERSSWSSSWMLAIYLPTWKTPSGACPLRHISLVCRICVNELPCLYRALSLFYFLVCCIVWHLLFLMEKKYIKKQYK